MSKAEDLSKQYRDYREQCGIKDPVMLDEIEEAYFEGYNQAEKDLELSWNDIALILNTAEEFNRKNTVPILDKDYFSEILKRFKESKK